MTADKPLAPDTKHAEAIICSDKCKADKEAGSKGDQPSLPRNINIDEPRYDQSTYRNRAIYFLTVTNPLNIFVSSKELDRAKLIVTKYRNGEELPSCVGEEELWHAKNLYDSAFHPDTGEKMWICGRMSAQVPMNMLITGGMMTFYKSTSSVIFWQWLNQSFNALVNYTNRSGDQAISNTQLGASYVLATSAALATALTLNNAVKRFPPVVGRMVPFAAVAAANCINIPLMRMQELSEGVPVFDQDNLRLGSSKVAAREGIAQVVISRILMASPGMAITPFIMNHLERKGVLRRYPWANAPIQIGLLGVFLTFATPLCCAIFRQKASIRVANLEPELREEIKKKSSSKDIEYVYYNKGL